jgi:hypothetical protein
MNNAIENNSLEEVYDKYDIIKVQWIDTISDNSGWNDPKIYDFDEHENQSGYSTIGFYIKTTQQSIFICMSANVDVDVCGNILSIPLSSIISTKRLLEDY